MSQTHTYDLLVLGSGAAGLTLALSLADSCKVAVLSKAEISETNTQYAQGGVAAVLDESDSFEAHVQDTLIAGGGLCHRRVVEAVVASGPKVVDWLVKLGVPFSLNNEGTNPQALHLHQEGGHSTRRIIHAADATGKAVSNTLIAKAKAHPNIHLFSHHMGLELLTHKHTSTSTPQCHGAYVFNLKTNQVEIFRAKFTALATGGASKAYLYSSNPDIATGDGIAMAWRAGCRVANMEFNQFHPTCLYHPFGGSFLLTEAIRGEGGYLCLPNGERFMHRFDSRLELAPRDIVARAIDHEIKRLGVRHLYLDIRHKGADFIQAHFPNVYQHCLELGLDITNEPIPVVPAAHYTCGGVMTNLQGQTDLPGLFAVGETAFTGLHGANRMASNSLLECFVFAFNAAESIQQQLPQAPEPPEVLEWDDSKVSDSDEEVVIAHNWNEIKQLMWDYVGILRSNKRLQRAKNRINLLKQEINDYYYNFKVSGNLLELRNLAIVAELIIDSAMSRHESRGLHFSLDYPDTLSNAQDTILCPVNAVHPSEVLAKRFFECAESTLQRI